MEPDQEDIALHMPFLEELASKASVIIELGCGKGNGSTRALSRGLRRSNSTDKVMVTVDWNLNGPEETPKYSWWYFLAGDSRHREPVRVASALLGLKAADLIFIDTDHTRAQIEKELKLWSWIASPDCVWVFHDTWMMGEYNPMTDAIKEFAASHGLEFIDYSRECHGLGLMRRAKT
jgi:cephalosporin hydroxylase